MDIKLFETKLLALLEECGASLTEQITITPTGAIDKDYYRVSGVETYGLDCFQAVRNIEKVNISININTKIVTKWNHISGDNSRLAHSLK